MTSRSPEGRLSSSPWLLDDGAARHSERERLPQGTRVGTPGRTLLRGIAAGMVGTTVPTLWLYAVDLLRGLPSDTAATLGAHVARAFGSSGWRDTTQLATLFTTLDCAAFVLAGVLAAIAARRRAGGAAGALAVAGVALAAVAVPLGALFVRTRHQVGSDVWGHVAAAHLAAALVVATFLWVTRARPARPGTRRRDARAP